MVNRRNTFDEELTKQLVQKYLFIYLFGVAVETYSQIKSAPALMPWKQESVQEAPYLPAHLLKDSHNGVDCDGEIEGVCHH